MRMDNTFQLISKIYSGMNELVSSELRNEGLSGLASSHGTILISLFGGKRLTMNELASKIGKTPQTVTTLVRKLSDMGYIKIEKSEQDRRTTVVRLSNEGEQLKTFFEQASEKLFDTQYKGLSESEAAEFHRLLSIVANNFIERGTKQ